MEIINNWDVTIFYWRTDIFKYLHFSSTITDTSHIPSTITLAKHLPSQKSKPRFNWEKVRFNRDKYNFNGINTDLSEILS